MPELERLNKFLAHAGVGSRRHCDDLIAAGRVEIDGRVVRDMGTRVDPAAQKVFVDHNPVRAERLVYWALHKPRGVICTNHDPAGRQRAVDLVPHIDQRVYTVGRLDANSEGLLVLTNDGDLANLLMHPRYGVEKTYLVLVAGSPSQADMDRLLEGVFLAEGKVKAKSVRRLKSQGESTWLRIVLNEGKNREIRRMLAKLDHKVMRLRRVQLGPIKLDRLPAKKSRKLSLPEIEMLRKSCRPARDDGAQPADKGERRPPRPGRPRQPGGRPPVDRRERPHDAPPRGERLRRSEAPRGDRPRDDRPCDDRPRQDTPRGDQPRGDRPRQGRPETVVPPRPPGRGQRPFNQGGRPPGPDNGRGPRRPGPPPRGKRPR